MVQAVLALRNPPPCADLMPSAPTMCGVGPLGDLLVARGDVLWTIEAKKNPAHSRRKQMGRLHELQRQLSGVPRIDGPDGASWVLESDVPLASYWTSAEPHLVRAVNEGVACWVPTPGVGVMFMSVAAAGLLGRAGWDAAVAREQQAAAAQIGPGQYAIIARSHDFPYRPNRAAPFTIFPVASRLAAMMLTNLILFTVEVRIERLLEALRDAGLEPRNLLVGQPTDQPLPQDLIEWRSATGRGTVHRGAMEQLAIELVDPSVWAAALASAPAPPAAARRWGLHFCFSKEEEVWA